MIATGADGAAVRQADVECLVSESIRELIRDEGIMLLSYRPLQELWRRR